MTCVATAAFTARALGRAKKREKRMFPKCGLDETSGHGTHVAGTIAGKTWGVAKAAKVVSIKVFCGGSRTADTSLILKAMDDVAAHTRGFCRGSTPYYHDLCRRSDRAVINLSLGNPGPHMVFDRVTDKIMEKNNIAIVAAAGNNAGSTCNYSPASQPRIIAVAAMHPKLDQRSHYSNFDKCVDIFAPGDVIESTSHTSDRDSALMSGTSMAAPHVAGAMAVLMGTGLDATAAKAKLLADATPNVIKDVKGAPNRLLYVAPVGPPTRRCAPKPSPSPSPRPRPRPRPGGGPCFEREASFAYAAASAGGPWVVT